MKKNLLTRMWMLLLTMVMVFNLIGCGAAYDDDDDDDRRSKKNKTKTEESDDEEEDESDKDDKAEATPEPTATPIPDLLSETDKATFDLLLTSIYEVSQMNYDLSVLIENCYASEADMTAGVEDIGAYAYNSLAYLQELQKNVNGYRFESTEEDVMRTVAVAKKYFAETIETYENLYNIGKTHTAALEALDYVSNSYDYATTELEVLERLYGE